MREFGTSAVTATMYGPGEEKSGTNRNSTARLVVLATEVGGRWNRETAQFITALVLQGRRSFWGCTAARAFCVSLLDCRPPGGTGETIPSVHEVMREARLLFSDVLKLFTHSAVVPRRLVMF